MKIKNNVKKLKRSKGAGGKKSKRDEDLGKGFQEEKKAQGPIDKNNDDSDDDERREVNEV